MDINWDQDNLWLADLSEKIVGIHLVAYPNPSNKGDDEIPPTNHWCLFFELPRGNSVRLDMTPGYGSDGLRGKIELSSKTHACTANNIQKVSYKVNSIVSLEDVVQGAQRNGRQKYQFTPEWEGCRYWNYVFIQDLENCKIIPPGASKQALDAMSCFYRSPAGIERRDMKIGKFLA